MAKIILCVNAGSSSVRVSVFQVRKSEQDPSKLAEVHVAGITAPPSRLYYTRGSEKTTVEELEQVHSQEDAFIRILDDLLADRRLPEVPSADAISCVCHRVVHGGDYLQHRLVTAETYHHLDDLTALAPLHNASALAIVQTCFKLLQKANNVAVFDTSFHHTLPDSVRTYMINRETAAANNLRKYGFHGISYSFIVRAVAQFLRKEPENLNIIALHLGSGASACAIQGGRSVDTSMGLTPLDGLPGATRSGSVDPSLVFHLGRQGNEDKELHEVRPPISQRHKLMQPRQKIYSTTDPGGLLSRVLPSLMLSSRRPTRDALSPLTSLLTGLLGSSVAISSSWVAKSTP
jgi:acetate kinase